MGPFLRVEVGFHIRIIFWPPEILTVAHMGLDSSHPYKALGPTQSPHLNPQILNSSLRSLMVVGALGYISLREDLDEPYVAQLPKAA